MIQRIAIAAALVAIGMSTGCATLSITGSDTRQENRVHGTVRVCGEDNDLTLLAGSDVEELSVGGEENMVFVQDGAVVRKIDLTGEDNRVSVPADAEFILEQRGEGNEIIRR